MQQKNINNKQEVKTFISYAREDLDYAQTLYNILKNVGVEPWLDVESILPGQKWRTAIKSAIKNCNYFITLLSSRSVSKKGYVQKELKEALEYLDEFPDSKIYIIPIRLDECYPSDIKLHDIQWVDFFPSWDKGIEKLFRVLVPEWCESREKLPNGEQVDDWLSKISTCTTITELSKLRWALLINGINLSRNEFFEKTSIPLPNFNLIDWISVPNGNFIMGSPQSEDYSALSEYPPHEVTISNSFEISSTLITNDMWAEFSKKKSPVGKGNYPLVNVSWWEAWFFTWWLTENGDLPSEAEWEYSARGGATTLFSCGNSFEQLKEYAWFSSNSGGGIRPVKKKFPNSWGIYDMHGNIWEWTLDSWHPNYINAPCNALAWDFYTHGQRVIRGGCWFFGAEKCRSASRHMFDSERGDNMLGFRPVRRTVSNFDIYLNSNKRKG